MKKIILGRDGMGPDATEADFQHWVAFVCFYIDLAAGEDVDVDALLPGGVQETVIKDADLYERNALQEALQHLWREYCAGRMPSASKLPGIVGMAHVDTPNGEEDEGPFLIDYPDSAERRR